MNCYRAYDWGTWWQANRRWIFPFELESDFPTGPPARPTESMGTGLIFYDFKFDRPDALGPTVTSSQAAHSDWYADWSVTGTSFLASWPRGAQK